MRVNRKFLNAGLFLVAIGAIVVAADQGAIDAATLAELVRLWPLVPIAIGVALVVRRTNVGLPAGMLAAAVPGLVLGSAFAVVPAVRGHVRRAHRAGARRSTADGPIGARRDVFVQTGCGTFNLAPRPATRGTSTRGNSRGSAPTVDEFRGRAAPDPARRWRALGLRHRRARPMGAHPARVGRLEPLGAR